jgi:hypothetical protein
MDTTIQNNQIKHIIWQTHNDYMYVKQNNAIQIENN